MNIKKIIPTRLYLQMMYFHHFHRFYSFRHPQLLNEKVQWLKIHDRKKEYINLVDKIAVKKYVADLVGEQYIIPNLAIWDDPMLIDSSSLPNEFVLKCNHDSHCVYVCHDKNVFDFETAKKRLRDRLSYNEYWYGREWPYRYVKPQVLAEQMLHGNNGDLYDYKIMCFNGVPDNIMVCTGRMDGNLRYYFFDRDWKFLKYQYVDQDLPDDFTLPKPDHLEEMFALAEKLSKGLPFVRVDLYDAEGRVWFGELTFYPCAGFDTDITPETDRLLGGKLDLSQVTN